MMEEKLPKGWEVYPLIELLDLLETGSRPKGGVQGIFDGIPSLGGEHLDYNGGFKFDKLKFIPLEFAKKMKRGKINEGDVLIVKDGATTGKTSYVDESFPFDEAYVNEHVFICRPNKNHSGKFISFFLRSKEGQKRILENFTGSAQGGINQKFAQITKVPLPALPEQQRIVAKLDALFGHLDSLREKLDGIPALLKNFRQQVLTQAVTGELTMEWREGGDLPEEDFIDLEDLEMREIKYVIPKSWQWLPFISVAEVKSNLVQPNEYLEFPLIAPDNIEAGTGKLINKPLVSEILPKSPKHYFREGDIVYSKIRPYLSKLVLTDFDGLCSADMYPISTTLNIKYLYYYMLSDVFLRYATTAGERSVLPKINQKELAIIPISVPSKKEQQEIVKRIEALFSLADKIESQYTSLKAKIDQLPQAILAKAFQGELVSHEVKEYVVKEREGLMAAEGVEGYGSE